MKKNTFKQYLQKIDTYLSKENNLLLAVFIFSVINYFIYIQKPTNWFNTYLFDIPVSVFFGSLTVWYYLSSRKYGFVDTTVFFIFLPFYVIFALIPIISPSKKKPIKVKKDYTVLVESLADSLNEKINDVYAGKVIEHQVEDDQICVTFEVPYGIKIPQQQIIHQIAPWLHIRESNITFSELTNRKTQFMITSGGLQDYDLYKKLCMPWDTFPELRDRILLRMPVSVVTQTQPAESI